MLRNAENAENADCDPLTTSPTDAIRRSSQICKAVSTVYSATALRRIGPTRPTSLLYLKAMQAPWSQRRLAFSPFCLLYVGVRKSILEPSSLGGDQFGISTLGEQATALTVLDG